MNSYTYYIGFGAIFFCCLLGDNPANAGTKITPDEQCALVGNVASIVMKGRQIGLPLSDMIKMWPKDRQLILSAFERPRYATPKMQEREIVDFRNDAELACFKR